MTDLRKLLDSATKGPWEVYGSAVLTVDHPLLQKAVCRISGPSDIGPPVRQGAANADLIVAAVNALPALLDIVEAAEEVQRGAESGLADALMKLPPLFAALAKWGKQ